MALYIQAAVESVHQEMPELIADLKSSEVNTYEAERTLVRKASLDRVSDKTMNSLVSQIVCSHKSLLTHHPIIFGHLRGMSQFLYQRLPEVQKASKRVQTSPDLVITSLCKLTDRSHFVTT